MQLAGLYSRPRFAGKLSLNVGTSGSVVRVHSTERAVEGAMAWRARRDVHEQSAVNRRIQIPPLRVRRPATLADIALAAISPATPGRRDQASRVKASSRGRARTVSYVYRSGGARGVLRVRDIRREGKGIPRQEGRDDTEASKCHLHVSLRGRGVKDDPNERKGTRKLHLLAPTY